MMASEQDPYLQAKEAEARMKKLVSEVQNEKKIIQLLDSEGKAGMGELNQKIEGNASKNKNLTSQLQKLQMSINKGLQARLAQSPQEAKEILNDKVMDLIKKSNALTNQLNVKEKYLADVQNRSKDIAWKTHRQFEMESLESDTLRQVRGLENDYQKVEMNLMECQIIQVKNRTIQEQLKRELMADPRMMEELEEQYIEQQRDVERLLASEAKAQERRDVARKELSQAKGEALRARQENEKIISEYSKVLKPKQLAMRKQSTELRDSEAVEQWRQLRTEHESELRKYHEAVEKITEAIGISDIGEAEVRFRSQQTTQEELAQLLAQAEDKFESLRTEAEELCTENESLQGAKLGSPQIVLEKKLEEAKMDNEEQLNRRSAAEFELERIKTPHADIKSGLWQQLQLMEKHLQEDEEGVVTTAPDEEAMVIVTKIENLLGRMLENMQNQDLEALKQELNDEEFMQELKAAKLVPSAGARKMKPAEEEEESDDEDLVKKRTAMKKEAQVYAEIKKKQQGRGRMMML